MFETPSLLDVQINEYRDLHQWKTDIENNMLHDYIPNININREILYNEVNKYILKLKNNKGTCIVSIPNEIIKCADVMQILRLFFQKCFDFGMIPSIWLKTNIGSIPKSP